MGKDNVVNMALEKGDCTLWDMDQMLSYAQEKLANDQLRGKKAILLMLDDEDGKYIIDWIICQMNNVELVVLLDSAKHIILQELNGTDEE